MPRYSLSKLLWIGFLPAIMLTGGCASSGANVGTSIGYGRSELQLIPAKSLERLASNHAADELVAVKVEGQSDPVVVRFFSGKDHVSVLAPQGQEQLVRFADVTDLLIIKLPKKDQQAAVPARTTASGAAGAVGEALVYAPMVPIAVVSWPLLNVMGLNGAKNSDDTARAGRIYMGLSRQDLIESIGEPREKYACTMRVKLKGKPDEAEEIWVYDEDKVLRGGRTLILESANGLVWHNSFSTTFFKESDTFECKPLADVRSQAGPPGNGVAKWKRGRQFDLSPSSVLNLLSIS